MAEGPRTGEGRGVEERMDEERTEAKRRSEWICPHIGLLLKKHLLKHALR